jgi:hypothetical protein
MPTKSWPANWKADQFMARRKRTFDLKKEVRKLARERVGTVSASRAIVPKLQRKKPKHKKPPAQDELT